MEQKQNSQECKVRKSRLDIYNEGCGCTCRECKEWHKELDKQKKEK